MKKDHRPKFNYAKNSDIAKHAAWIASVLLSISTVTGTYRIFYIIKGATPQVLEEALPEWFLWLCSGASLGLAFSIAIALDFRGVRSFGSFVFTHILAILSRKFHTSIMQKASVLVSTIAFAAFAWLSYVSSRDGAKMIASLVPVDNIASEVQSKIEKNEAIRKNSIAPFKKEVDGVKAKIEAEFAAEKRMLSDNSSANVNYLRAQIEKRHAKELAQAQKNLEAETARFDKMQSSFTAALSSEQKQQTERAEIKTAKISSIMELLGAWSLILAIVLLAIESIAEVTNQIKDDNEPSLLEMIKGLFSPKP